jgi:hypothetical protein
MAIPTLIDGRLYTPYRIYIRSAGFLSDTDLLQIFGLTGYRPPGITNRYYRYAVLANAGEWVMLADDWYYTLWSMPSTRHAIAAIGASWDLFACSVGDCDRSFDFVCYRAGHLVRRYVIDDQGFRGGAVAEDYGDPLLGEAVALGAADEMDRVLGVARSLGIKTDYNEQDVRVYASVEPNRL